MTLSTVLFSMLLITMQNAGSAPTPPAATEPAQAGAAATNQTPQQIASHYVDFWNTGDFGNLKPFISAFVITSHGRRTVADEKMLTHVVDTWRKSIPDLNFKVQETITQDDKVVMRLVFTGTYKTRLFPNTVQPIPSAPPRAIRVSEVLIFRIKDGKIAEVWEQYDDLAMREQMGARFVPGDQLDTQQAKEYKSVPQAKTSPK